MSSSQVPPRNHATARRSVDLAIVHGYVVTMDESRRVFADGAVAVLGGEIVAVGPTPEILAQFEPLRMIDAAGGSSIPGS